MAEPAVPEPHEAQPSGPPPDGLPASIRTAPQMGHDIEVDIAAFLPDDVEVVTDDRTEPVEDAIADDDAIDLELLGQLEADLDSVDQALKAIDGGTYGMCAACGTDLDPASLQADPVRALCEAHLPVR